MRKVGLFTCESVTEGHPDKMCDGVSDVILDACLKQDPMSRVACETTATTGVVTVMGEITTSALLDIPKLVRDKVVRIGYDSDEKSFNGRTCAVNVLLDKQSLDIAQGVDVAIGDSSIGAGDQGMMFGYATNETDVYLPYALVKSHELVRRLTDIRRSKYSDLIYPDGKSQVTVLYDENGKLIGVDSIVISSQHSENLGIDKLCQIIQDEVINYVFRDDPLYDGSTVNLYVNPTGRFVVGGPLGDSGLTGRKIIVDTYGGYAPHGGGAFSGKDSTKVDRSGAYMARYIAKNIVANHICDSCTVQLAYVIGVAEPVSVNIECDGLSPYATSKVKEQIVDLIDLRPSAIIDRFNLRSPIFEQTSSYGHFGNCDFPWEKIDLKLHL